MGSSFRTRNDIYPSAIKSATFSVMLIFLAGRCSADVAYSNNFNAAPGSSFPEWTSSSITYVSSASPPGSGTLAPQTMTNVQSPNGAQRFLGEFGGPQIGQPNDPGYNHTRVDQTITLTLSGLPAHRSAEVKFDLYVLKSWDGNSAAYGPDRWSLSVAGGPTLLDTTFSNNPKTSTDGSFQNYPVVNSDPWTGAAAVGTLGYDSFFKDSIYHFDYTFDHSDSTLTLNFHSSLFEGKGTADESWGLDNVQVNVVPEPSSLLLIGLAALGLMLVAAIAALWCRPLGLRRNDQSLDPANETV
jgi:hypothetical protein